MKQYRTLFLLIIPVFLATFFFTAKITSTLGQYEKNKQEKAELLDAEARLGDIWEWDVDVEEVSVTGWLTDWISGKEDAMEKASQLDKEASAYYNKAIKEGLILLGIVVAFLIIINLVYKKPELRASAIGLSLVIASVCFLYLGLNEPFIEIEAYKDNVAVGGEILGMETSGKVDGRVYFFYQNKSVLKLVELLYLGGNFFVAIMIIIFSMLFPAIKLISSFIIFLNPSSNFSQKSVALIDKIGKWSMADVFVAAAWLAYFSFANTEFAIETGASTLIGLYFFTAFVIFSMISGIYLKRTVIKYQNKNGG